MAQMIYVNLPVKNLPAAREFFTRLGYSINPAISNDDAACVVFSDTICAMLLTEPFFKSFTHKPIADATTSTEVIVCLAVASQEQVDEIVDKALAAGGATGAFSVGEGFMYGRSFTDLDGHIWEIIWTDPAAIQG